MTNGSGKGEEIIGNAHSACTEYNILTGSKSSRCFKLAFIEMLEHVQI